MNEWLESNKKARYDPTPCFIRCLYYDPDFNARVMGITLGERERGEELGCLLRVAVAALSQIVSKRDSHSPFLWQDHFCPPHQGKLRI